MMRLCLLLCVLCFGVGCTAEDKAQMNDALKDLRGDNMEMRGLGDRSMPERSRPADGR